MSMIVIMPGGFHPFHAGHFALYQSAKRAFPGAEVYVAATNDQSERPFPFSLKEKLAKLAGVEAGHFVQVKSPFQSKEIMQHYNPEEDVLVFVRSEKDRNESPKPGGTKKDGSPAYFQPWTGKDVQPFGKHAYFEYLPTVEFGPGITSATQIRNAWPTLNDKRKTALVMSLYPAAQQNPKLAQTVAGMFDQVMGGQVDEAIDDNIRISKGKPTTDEVRRKYFDKAVNSVLGGQDTDIEKNKASQRYFKVKQITDPNVDESAEEALQYATQAHAGQTRTGGDPYITHPIRVADHIKQYKQSHNLDALISAAYLHDTVEDTDTTHEALNDLFGGLVASLVQELTSDPEQIKKMGKAQYLAHKMAAMSSYALVIKLADRLDNVKDITTARTPAWRAKYANETNHILDYIENTRALSGTHKKLIELIRVKLAEINNAPQGVAEAVEEEPGLQHRIAVKVTDPKTYDDVQKIVRVDATDKQDALDQVEEFYAKKGIYIVSIKYLGMVGQQDVTEDSTGFDYDKVSTLPGKERMALFKAQPELKKLYYAEFQKRVDAELNNYNWMTPEEKTQYEKLAASELGQGLNIDTKKYSAEKYLKQLFQQKMDAKKAASMLKVHWAPLKQLESFLQGKVNNKTELSAYLAPNPESLGKQRWGSDTVGIVLDGHITIGGRGDLGSDQYRTTAGQRGQQKYVSRPGQIDPTLSMDTSAHHEVLIDNWKIKEIVLPANIPPEVDSLVKQYKIPVRRLTNPVAEGAPIVVMPRADRLKKAEPTKVRYQGDIVPPTKPPSTEKRGVKGRPGQRPMPTYESNIPESTDYLDEK